MKQTAVEWLVEKIQQANPTFKFDALIREANAMFEEQIKNSYHSGTIDGFNFRTTSISPNPEQYYNETFKSE